MDYKAVYEALKSPKEIEKLLSDPKQTATALLAVKYGIFESSDTNLSYNLMALSKLLSEHPSAWNVVDQSLIDKITQVATIVDQAPIVLCPALSVLTLITLDSKKYSNRSNFPSLEQSITPDFIESLVSRLLSPNVQIIHAALQLINATILCFVLTKPDRASPYFEQLRDAGLLRNASQLFENKPLAASCSPQLYDLQELIRSAFSQNKEVEVNLSDALHRESFKRVENMLTSLIGTNQSGSVDWQRSGLSEGQDPVSEFNASLKWAGVQDFNDFLAQDEMVFKKMYLEHLAFAPVNARFPLVSASLAVSEIMFEIFGVNDASIRDYFKTVPDSFVPPPYIVPSSPSSTTDLQVSSSNTTKQGSSTSMLSPSPSMSEIPRPIINGTNISVESELAKLGKLRPLIFDWTMLHSAGIVNFLRLWLVSSAQREDFENINEVVRILFAQAIPVSDFSTVSIDSVISKLDTLSYADIRAIQLQNIEEDLNNQWGLEIRSLHNQFQQESYNFVKEQRIRLLLRGEWFYVDNPTLPPPNSSNSRGSGSRLSTSSGNIAAPTSRRYFVALSPSLNTLHYSEYSQRLEEYPAVDALSRSIDLSTVSKVVVTSLTSGTTPQRKNRLRVNLQSRTNYSKIALIFSGSRDGSTLSFYTDTPEKAAAWGDGLLMLKNKSYQSTETKKYIDMFAETKLRLQMMQITPDDLAYSVKNPLSAVDFESVRTSDDFYFS